MNNFYINKKTGEKYVVVSFSKMNGKTFVSLLKQGQTNPNDFDKIFDTLIRVEVSKFEDEFEMIEKD